MLVVGCVLAIVVMLGLKGGVLTERTRIVMIDAVCRLLSFYNKEAFCLAGFRREEFLPK